jgi:1,4-dihydroxy-2-naphthoate octaprenyltransferase
MAKLKGIRLKPMYFVALAVELLALIAIIWYFWNAPLMMIIGVGVLSVLVVVFMTLGPLKWNFDPLGMIERVEEKE